MSKKANDIVNKPQDGAQVAPPAPDNKAVVATVEGVQTPAIIESKWFSDSKRKIKDVEDLENLLLPKTDTKKLFDTTIKKIFAEGDKMDKSKVVIAFALLKAYDYELHTQDPDCKNFYEYAFKYFGISKTEVSQCLQVARRFGKYETTADGKYIPKYTLEDKFAGFSVRKLYAIRALNDCDIEDKIKPEMTVVQLTNFAKFILEGGLDRPALTADYEDDDAEEIDAEEFAEEVTEKQVDPKKLVKLVQTVNLDKLMDKPIMLEIDKSRNYILSLDKSNNLVVEIKGV